MLNIIENNSTVTYEDKNLDTKPSVSMDASIANANINFDPAKLVELSIEPCSPVAL